MWKADPDSCAGVTAYCSVLDVGYDISCGSSDPKGSGSFAYTSGRAFCVRRGLRDSAYWDFLQIWHRSTAHETGGAKAKEECDDGIDLVR